jgi:hypothetical protein
VKEFDNMQNPNSKFVPDPKIESIYEILDRYVLVKVEATANKVVYKCVEFKAKNI